MQEYVLGFLIDDDGGCVALIRKESPSWQKGRLNGIGGKIEPNELPAYAMEREFREETSHTVPASKWDFFAKMYGKNRDWCVYCYVSYGPVTPCITTTKEQVIITTVKSIHRDNIMLIENLPYLFEMIESRKKDGVSFYGIEYNRTSDSF